MDKQVDLQGLDEGARALVQRLLAQVQAQATDLKHKQALLDKLMYEMALLKRLKFAAKTEALNTDQRNLLEDDLEEDLQAVHEEVEQLQSEGQRTPRQQPKRLPLPAQLPRQEFKHEPEVTECCNAPMHRIGEDVAEKLDYTPGVFSVHRHVRGKWVCACCQTLKQKPVDAHILDKGIPTTGLLAQVLVAKRRPSASVPPRGHLRPRWRPNPTLEPGALGGQLRCATAAAGRCAAPGGVGPQSGARR